MILMKDELPFASDELCFVELWGRLKPWLQQRGVTKQVRRHGNHRCEEAPIATRHQAPSTFTGDSYNVRVRLCFFYVSYNYFLPHKTHLLAVWGGQPQTCTLILHMRCFMSEG